MNDNTLVADAAGAALRACADGTETAGNIGFVYEVECWRDGALVWREARHNLVTTVGKTDMLQQYFLGNAYTAAWYLGLKSAGTATTADTMASHAGWAENTTVSNATRPAVSFNAALAGSISNSTSRAVFAMNGTTTVCGCFLTTNNTLGGTAGTLFNAVDFTAPRSVLSGDVLSCQLTLTLT